MINAIDPAFGLRIPSGWIWAIRIFFLGRLRTQFRQPIPHFSRVVGRHPAGDHAPNSPVLGRIELVQGGQCPVRVHRCRRFEPSGHQPFPVISLRLFGNPIPASRHILVGPTHNAVPDVPGFPAIHHIVGQAFFRQPLAADAAEFLHEQLPFLITDPAILPALPHRIPGAFPIRFVYSVQRFGQHPVPFQRIAAGAENLVGFQPVPGNGYVRSACGGAGGAGFWSTVTRR